MSRLVPVGSEALEAVEDVVAELGGRRPDVRGQDGVGERKEGLAIRQISELKTKTKIGIILKQTLKKSIHKLINILNEKKQEINQLLCYSHFMFD